MSKLIIFHPNGTNRSLDLQTGRLPIGRHVRNAIVLPDPRVSAVHAILQCTGSGWWIEDMSSTNGTWINHRRVHTSLLREGDALEIGDCTLRLLDAPENKSVRRLSPPSNQSWIDEALTIPADFGPTSLACGY